MYLNKKYSGNIFHILRSYKFIIDYEDLSFQMYFNNMRFQMGYYDNKKILPADIIIIIGIPDTPEEFLNYKINDLNPIEKGQFNEKEQDLLLKKIRYMRNEIDEQYYKIDEFYLDENQKEETKVILLGKRDKFSQFSE
jgi:hypothetical protein